MKDMEKASLIIFTVILLALVIWLRVNLIYFFSILEASTLFFQLIIGASVIAVLRNYVGVRTFGVFGPTIIVFGLISAGLFWGFALYVDVFLIAMLVTFVLHPLGISSSHRVAIVITTTVISIMVMELFGELYHMDMLQSSILFPVLITSWLAERYVGQVKEVYWIDPSKRLLGTVIAIFIAYFIMSYDPFIKFIALNPETWMIIIFAHIGMAMKFNFRLTDHIRYDPLIKTGSRLSTDVLGMNRRNRDYITRYNPRSFFPNVSKEKMKSALHLLGIPAPMTYGIIEERKDLKKLKKILENETSFVIKPANGHGGEGILIIDKDVNDSKKTKYRSNGTEYTQKDLENHISEILDGSYSSDWSDVAIIEEKIIADSYMNKFSAGGLPDIRVIVFAGFPLMAMTRLPTIESAGKANLHKGAIGMGLTISDGRGVNPVWKGHTGKLTKHPDTGSDLGQFKLPHWNETLRIACMAGAASRLGYVGVDIVLDKKGPLVLEVNKRPGLEIQNTNLAGLLKRLEFVEARVESTPDISFQSLEKRIELARKWDGGGWK
jgi:alpha-L-glutamate ligase-like protein